MLLKLMKPIFLAACLTQFGCSTPSYARPLSEMTIMAHRGLYQTYPRENIKPNTCTAEIIYPPTHDFLENTIPSIAKALELNADTIELDIHSTKDGKIVVFHDWTLECRTNGQGVSEDQTFDYLRSLDIGYGYTADSHTTHPFRCEKGAPAYADCMKKHQMPTLREVLQAFPMTRFVINMKSKRPFTLITLVKELKSIAQDLPYNLGNLAFYCNDTSINDQMRQLLPEIEVPKLRISDMKACIDAHLKGGTFPPQCRDAHLGLPIEDFRSLGKTQATQLISAIHAINGKFLALRVDTAADAQYLENFEVDGIWTDRIDIVGPLINFNQITAALKSFDEKVLSLKADFSKIPADPNSKAWVTQKLAHMVEVDQYMRSLLPTIQDRRYTPKEQRFFWREFLPRWQAIDSANTIDLKALLKIYGWIKISEFDAQADSNAWLLVQHADHDPGFQSEVLATLEHLVKLGETNLTNYAYLVDRVAASWQNPAKRKLQRYGTQGLCTGPGKWEPIPMEDPANVDLRRKEVGLGPLKEYTDRVTASCS